MEPADAAQLKGLEATLERLAAEKVAAEAAIEQLLQKLPADPNLVYFYGDGCSFTQRAKPHVQCLETSIGKRLTKLETWYSKENSETYDAVKGKELCGGVPFFFNKLTGNSVCGAKPCDVLKVWANAPERVGDDGKL